MATRTSVKVVFFSIIITLFIAITLLALEIFVRSQNRYGVNGIQYSNTEIWRWRKNISDKIVNEDGETFICHTDKFGFRNYNKTEKKPADVIRVLIIGDSYTAGLSYADDKIYTAQLEKNLAGIKKDGKRIEVINASSPAWGTDQELVCLQNEAMYFEPDYVLLMACPNDIREAYCKKFVKIGPNGEIWFQPIKYRTREILGWKLSNRSHLYQYLQENVFHTNYGSFENLMGHYSFNFGKEDSTSWDRPVFLKEPITEVQEARQLFYTLLNEMHKTCKEKNIPFAISLIPIVEEFNGAMQKDTAMQSGIVSEQLQQYCDSAHIDYIDLYSRFKADSDPVSHYLKSDFHYNAKGHTATANGLTDYYKGVFK